MLHGAAGSGDAGEVRALREGQWKQSLEMRGSPKGEERGGPCPASPHLPTPVHTCPHLLHLPMPAACVLPAGTTSCLPVSVDLVFLLLLRLLSLPPPLHPLRMKQHLGRPLPVARLGRLPWTHTYSAQLFPV